MTYFSRKIERKVNSDRKENIIKIRSTKNYSKEVFCQKLSAVVWSDLYLCRDVNGAWVKFKDIFTSILNEVAPKREIKVKNHTELWMSSEILELIQKKRSSFEYV